MNQLSSVVLALMMILTSMSTGSIGLEEIPNKTSYSNSFAFDGNDTLNRTNTFPFDVLFDDYHEYYEVVSQLQVFANDFPDIVEFYTLTDIIPAGQTWQGNEVGGVKISDNVANEPDFYDDPNEETFFIVGNHHAREWMTVVTPLYFIYYLTHFYGMEPTDNDGDGLIDESDELGSALLDRFGSTTDYNNLEATTTIYSNPDSTWSVLDEYHKFGFGNYTYDSNGNIVFDTNDNGIFGDSWGSDGKDNDNDWGPYVDNQGNPFDVAAETNVNVVIILSPKWEII